MEVVQGQDGVASKWWASWIPRSERGVSPRRGLDLSDPGQHWLRGCVRAGMRLRVLDANPPLS